MANWDPMLGQVSPASAPRLRGPEEGRRRREGRRMKGKGRRKGDEGRRREKEGRKEKKEERSKQREPKFVPSPPRKEARLFHKQQQRWLVTTRIGGPSTYEGMRGGGSPAAPPGRAGGAGVGLEGMAGAGRPPPGTGGGALAAAGGGARRMLPPGDGGPEEPILRRESWLKGRRGEAKPRLRQRQVFIGRCELAGKPRTLIFIILCLGCR